MKRAGLRFFGFSLFVLFVFLEVLSGGRAWAADAERVREAAQVLREIRRIPEKGIPPRLLRQAQGLAIVPSVLKVGFILGVRRGTGVVIVRGKDGAWGSAREITLTSGSVGYQVGMQSADVVLVFKTKKSVKSLLRGKFTLGADANVAAGPVGRHAEATTDLALQAEVYAYSRSRGLFAGVSLEGSVLSVGQVLKAPSETARLVKALAP